MGVCQIWPGWKPNNVNSLPKRQSVWPPYPWYVFLGVDALIWFVCLHNECGHVALALGGLGLCPFQVACPIKVKWKLKQTSKLTNPMHGWCVTSLGIEYLIGCYSFRFTFIERALWNWQYKRAMVGVVKLMRCATGEGHTVVLARGSLLLVNISPWELSKVTVLQRCNLVFRFVEQCALEPFSIMWFRS